MRHATRHATRHGTRHTTRLTLIPRDSGLTIAARGPLTTADADRLAAICVSLPAQTHALLVDLTGAGLVGADALHRIARGVSRWRYRRSAPVTLRFLASRLDAAGEPLADEVPVEVRYPSRDAVRVAARIAARDAARVAVRGACSVRVARRASNA